MYGLCNDVTYNHNNEGTLCDFPKIHIAPYPFEMCGGTTHKHIHELKKIALVIYVHVLSLSPTTAWKVHVW